ncbi:nnp-1 protein putative nuclear protein 1 nop52 [Anaeramoeba flamelloides]|uniref:Nnp-1 protein putative nuclear protein 1 nop52 n=1 Tax=Anaeramoeba flamelloides TaxID=1746091 RepID=A0AAV7Z0Y2_9EUKA|nr:nnp-1 protein putative nuclear protein 1 nop52 [Anaeramoeba flamelloides]
MLHYFIVTKYLNHISLNYQGKTFHNYNNNYNNQILFYQNNLQSNINQFNRKRKLNNFQDNNENKYRKLNFNINNNYIQNKIEFEILKLKEKSTKDHIFFSIQEIILSMNLEIFIEIIGINFFLEKKIKKRFLNTLICNLPSYLKTKCLNYDNFQIERIFLPLIHLKLIIPIKEKKIEKDYKKEKKKMKKMFKFFIPQLKTNEIKKESKQEKKINELLQDNYLNFKSNSKFKLKTILNIQDYHWIQNNLNLKNFQNIRIFWKKLYNYSMSIRSLKKKINLFLKIQPLSYFYLISAWKIIPNFNQKIKKQIINEFKNYSNFCEFKNNQLKFLDKSMNKEIDVNYANGHDFALLNNDKFKKKIYFEISQKIGFPQSIIYKIYKKKKSKNKNIFGENLNFLEAFENNKDPILKSLIKKTSNSKEQKLRVKHLKKNPQQLSIFNRISDFPIELYDKIYPFSNDHEKYPNNSFNIINNNSSSSHNKNQNQNQNNNNSNYQNNFLKIYKSIASQSNFMLKKMIKKNNGKLKLTNRIYKEVYQNFTYKDYMIFKKVKKNQKFEFLLNFFCIFLSRFSICSPIEVWNLMNWELLSKIFQEGKRSIKNKIQKYWAKSNQRKYFCNLISEKRLLIKKEMIKYIENKQLLLNNSNGINNTDNNINNDIYGNNNNNNNFNNFNNNNNNNNNQTNDLNINLNQYQIKKILFK